MESNHLIDSLKTRYDLNMKKFEENNERFLNFLLIFFILNVFGMAYFANFSQTLNYVIKIIIIALIFLVIYHYFLSKGQKKSISTEARDNER